MKLINFTLYHFQNNNNNQNHTEMFVRSTDVNRTLNSAAS